MARKHPEKPTREFIQKAISAKTWDFGNDVLYGLCQRNLDHTRDEVIIAKVWLIGRSYAAAIERRRGKKDFIGDEFYEKEVAPTIRESLIDSWFQALSNDSTNSLSLNIETHMKVMDLFRSCCAQDQRSLASKYLHFHFPERFYIFDSRAERTISKLTKPIGSCKNLGTRLPTLQEHDERYARFYLRCQDLNSELSECVGSERLSPRELDKVLLAWNQKNPPSLVERITPPWFGT